MEIWVHSSKCRTGWKIRKKSNIFKCFPKSILYSEQYKQKCIQEYRLDLYQNFIIDELASPTYQKATLKGTRKYTYNNSNWHKNSKTQNMSFQIQKKWNTAKRIKTVYILNKSSKSLHALIYHCFPQICPKFTSVRPI